MKKLTIWILIVGAAIFVGAILDRSCNKPGPSPEYLAELEDYKQQVADQAAGLENVFKLLAERDATIQMQDQFVVDGQRKIMELEATQDQSAQAGRELADENARLKQDAAAAIAANPAVRALIDNYDLRCTNYEKQIFTLTERDAERVKIIEAKDVQLIAVTFQRDAWKKEFEKADGLRKVSDMLRTDLERSYKVSKFWTAIGKWGPPAAFLAGLALGK